MERIELNIDSKKALYHSETRIVTHCTRHGVMMECEIPKDWALTRIFQFMDSLLKNSDEII
jgi:hypothetical protein